MDMCVGNRFLFACAMTVVTTTTKLHNRKKKRGSHACAVDCSAPTAKLNERTLLNNRFQYHRQERTKQPTSNCLFLFDSNISIALAWALANTTLVRCCCYFIFADMKVFFFFGFIWKPHPPVQTAAGNTRANPSTLLTCFFFFIFIFLFFSRSGQITTRLKTFY